MLPKDAMPDTYYVCSRCDKVWPCEAKMLRSFLSDLILELEEVADLDRQVDLSAVAQAKQFLEDTE